MKNKYDNIMEELVGRKIINATHIIYGRIDNKFRLQLDNDKTLVFSAENSEFGLKLEEPAEDNSINISKKALNYLIYRKQDNETLSDTILRISSESPEERDQYFNSILDKTIDPNGKFKLGSTLNPVNIMFKVDKSESGEEEC